MKGCKSIWFKTGVISSLLLAVGFLQSSMALSLFGAVFLLACLFGVYFCDENNEQFDLKKPFTGLLPIDEKHVQAMYCMFIESTPKGLYHAVLEHDMLRDMYIAAQTELEALFGKPYVCRMSRNQFVVMKKFPSVHTMDYEERDVHQRWVTNSVSQVLSNLIAVYDKEAMQMTELTIGTAASGLRYRTKSIEDLIELAHFTQKTAQRKNRRYLVADEAVRARKMDIDECIIGFQKDNCYDEFNPFFQPVIDPVNFQIKGFESLARWQLGGYRVLDAKVFKDLAFELNRIEMIDSVIIQKTFAAAQSLHNDNLIPEDFRIVINISASSLVSFSAAQLALLAEDYNLNLRHIEFDIRDQVISDPFLSGKIDELRMQGFRVALDAFDQKAFDLKAFFHNQFDTLKLDFSHYNSSQNESEDIGEYVYDSLIQMAANLKIETLAKGIESREQLAKAKKMMVNSLQGNYFTPAVTLADFRIFIKKYRDGLYLEEYAGSSELA